MSNGCYSVFQNLLRSLSLQEFPCGFGSWRNPNEKYADSYSSVTTKDYGVNYEKMETLQGYLESGTWDVDTCWSGEARTLQNIAVVTPGKLQGEKGKNFIHDYFRSLRLVDKEISHIDADMTRLKNLENLTLSVNQLTEVMMRNLPRKLKVLELCMNKLASVTSLCRKPPELLHLGLSHNFLHEPDEYKFFSVNYWPCLLSLDLGHNNLNHLVPLVDHLATLPLLKSLVLQGNPLALSPGYRGYTLDVLRGLIIFDDVHVSADEKHRFKGLGRRREAVTDEAHFVVSVDTLGGVPVPDELKEVENRDEFPVVTTHYIIRYNMLKGATESRDDSTSLASALDQPMDVQESEFESQELPWSSWIGCNYQKHHVINDLVAFRDYIREGMRVQVVSKKVCAWPVEAEGGSPDLQGRKSGLKSAKKEKDGKGKEKSAKGKKKQEPVKDMRSDPPVYEQVGSKNVVLSFLLDGGSVLEEVLHLGGGPMIDPEELKRLEAAERLQAEEATKSESRKKPRNTSSSSKGKEKKNEAKVEGNPTEEPPPPKPITLQVRLQLKKWSTASESQTTLLQ